MLERESLILLAYNNKIFKSASAPLNVCKLGLYSFIMYTQTTQDIKVTVFPNYLAEHSEPDNFHYLWSYTIQLENFRKDSVQLLNRHWQITDAMGMRQEIRGAGVVGSQPILKPGEAFSYTSGVPLRTSSGIMMGEYEMMLENGERIDVTVPAFSLDTPEAVQKPN